MSPLLAYPSRRCTCAHRGPCRFVGRCNRRREPSYRARRSSDSSSLRTRACRTGSSSPAAPGYRMPPGPRGGSRSADRASLSYVWRHVRSRVHAPIPYPDRYFSSRIHGGIAGGRAASAAGTGRRAGGTAAPNRGDPRRRLLAADASASDLPRGALGDLNGDGRPDLVVANQLSNSISVLLNTAAPGAATAELRRGGSTSRRERVPVRRVPTPLRSAT